MSAPGIPSRTKLPPPSQADYEATDANARKHRYDRRPPAGGRVRALEELHDSMVESARNYQGSLQDKRDSIVSQLLAIKDFLEAQGFALPTLEPLMHPVSSLVEREQNRLDPIFVERKGAGRPKRSLEVEHRTGLIAALSDVWLAAHKDDDRTQKQKLAAFARECSGGWMGRLTEAKVRNAREIVSQESSSHPAVSWSEMYRAQLAETTLIWDAATAIKMIMKCANRLHSNKI